MLSPTSRNSYADLGGLAQRFVRTGWRMLVCGDILQKMLLHCRPYERERGSVDDVYEACLNDVCRTAEETSVYPPVQIKALRQALERARDRFVAVPLDRGRPTLRIGVVGEIFCRLNTFSNDDLVRRIEEFGCEVWLSDIAEWVWYTMAEERRILKLEGREYSTKAFGSWMRRRIQHHDEQELLKPFRREFVDCQEPEVETVLECARPYLPPEGALGEMVLNVGKAIYLAGRGVDGIIDISPFTCMNGIVSEAIYPRVSRDFGGIPIRNFYFDGTQNDLERDLGVYVELARTYRRRKA
jgi:predicted nucleotide-binding protein (sugar kinase/HSP70/actin superfamily)